MIKTVQLFSLFAISFLIASCSSNVTVAKNFDHSDSKAPANDERVEPFGNSQQFFSSRLNYR